MKLYRYVGLQPSGETWSTGEDLKRPTYEEVDLEGVITWLSEKMVHGHEPPNCPHLAVNYNNCDACYHLNELAELAGDAEKS